MADIRANAVEVAKIGSKRQARCRIEGCGWEGRTWDTYQEANAERV